LSLTELDRRGRNGQGFEGDAQASQRVIGGHRQAAQNPLGEGLSIAGHALAQERAAKKQFVQRGEVPPFLGSA
jgi:hypothetical protein